MVYETDDHDMTRAQDDGFPSHHMLPPTDTRRKIDAYSQEDDSSRMVYEGCPNCVQDYR